ncbi:MAG: hypothetical protein KIS66_01265 [Fimbriimonadaceae bacterium]|nr:hypothetical protein [Fimbriimonadaceae bacterium]
MSRFPLLILALGFVAMVVSATLSTKSTEDAPLAKLKAEFAARPSVPVNHSKCSAS